MVSRLFCLYFAYCAFFLTAQTDIRYLEYLYQENEHFLLQYEITKIYQEKIRLNHKEECKISLLQYSIQDTNNPYFLPVLQKALKIKKGIPVSVSYQHNEQEKYLYNVSKAYKVHKKKQILPVCTYQDSFLTQQHAQLLKIQQNYLKKPKKSSFVAGVMSAVLPGLGKVYAGKPVQMIVPLLSTVVWTAQAVEIAIKSGYTHFAFWIPVSIGSLFHFSNIYGSYRLAKTYNLQQKKMYYAQLDTLLDTFAKHYSQR
jgi:TM2 domain-containing membrane protein YozV